jgi:hypothetical protein
VQFVLSDGSMPPPTSVSPRTFPERVIPDVTLENGILTLTCTVGRSTVVYQGKLEGKTIKGTITRTIAARTPPPETKDTYWMSVPPRIVSDTGPQIEKWVAKRAK